MTEDDYEYRDQQREAYGLELFFLTMGCLVLWGMTWLA